MPQMSPMMWLYLFIYFLLIYLIIIIMIYNLYILNFIIKIFKNNKLNYLKIKNFNYLW